MNSEQFINFYIFANNNNPLNPFWPCFSTVKCVWGTLCLGGSVAGVCVWLVQTLSWGMGLIVCWTRLTSHLFARTALRPLYLFFFSFSLSAFFSQSSWRHDWGSVEFEPLCGFTSGLVVFGSCRYFGCGAFVGQLSGLWGYYNTSGTPNG